MRARNRDSRKRRNLFANTLLIAVSLVVAAVLGEVTIRLLMKDRVNLFPRYHAAVTYGDFTVRRMRPNTVFWHTSVDGSWKFAINNQGFRNDTDFTYEKPAGRLRIVSLGDSHTAGFEVAQDQTFSAVTQAYLRKQGIDSEVINTGVSGFSTAEALVFLENEGVKYEPDAVVLGFYANDFVDNIKAGLFSLKNGELTVSKLEHTPGMRVLNIINNWAILRWLGENSYVYSFGLNTTWELAKNLLTRRARRKVQTEYAVASSDTSNYEEELARTLISRMYAFCRSNNIVLIVLDIPKVSSPGNIHSSIPADLVEHFSAHSDQLIYSPDALSDHKDNSDVLHVPNGHRHISALTHSVYGERAAVALLELLRH